MGLEAEFDKHWAMFHDNIKKALTLLELYPPRKVRRIMEGYKEAVPASNECFIDLLKIQDKRLLEVLKRWKEPDETSKLARQIYMEKVGGHLQSDVVYTFWKYADVVALLQLMRESIEQKVILEQSVVVACTAFEHFLKELIPWILGNHEESAKRYLGKIGRPVKELGKYEFDPLRNVGKIFADESADRQFPVFPDVVDFYRETLGIRLFRSEKEERVVRRIFEVRHCIVHRAGRPDQRWRMKTGGAKYVLDLPTTRRYVLKIDAKLHESAVLVFLVLGLDASKAPFKPPKGEAIQGYPARWRFGHRKRRAAAP